MTVGVVGGGQLGRMLALAGIPLGLDFLFVDRSASVPAGALAPVLCGEFTDRRLLRRLARNCEVITFDWENVSVDALRRLDARVAPPLAALAIAQDRLREKQLFARLGIPTNRCAPVDSLAALGTAVREIGLPGVLKTRRLGYDGKGQQVLRRPADVARAWRALGSAPLLYEQFVPFEQEVSLLGVRSSRGEVALYPLCHNVHAGGILRLTHAPLLAPRLERQARQHVRRVLESLDYVGVLAIEFFVQHGRLLANEMAPRVHNSGHWTIEGAATSQFENHLRAILGLPLGSTSALGHSAMLNLIGRMPPRRALLAERGLHLHDYGKQPRPGRKLGHATLVASTARERDQRSRRLLARCYPRLGRLA